MHLFLHGFLGQKEDWDPVWSHLDSSLPLKALNLPGHGGEPMAEDIVLAIKEKVGKAQTLIGYSAGGRVCLELKARFPQDFGRVIAISAHPGLASEKKRDQRIQQDKKWIDLLHTVSLEKFLLEWEKQSLFSPFSQEVMERRKTGNPHHLAQFLERFGVGQKSPPQIYPDTLFICGKQDLKYVELYRKLSKSIQVVFVENAFHAVHLERPDLIANIVNEVIDEYTRCANP